MIQRLGVPHPAIGHVPYLRDMILQRYPNARFNESANHRLSEDELIAFLADCDGAIMGGDIISDRLLTALPQLRNIGIFGVGLNTVDLAACQRHGVKLGHRGGVNKLAVAELTLCFMLTSLRWVTSLNLAMRDGQRPRTRIGRNLTGRVVGIHGCGHIGKEVVRLLQPFGCTLIANDQKDMSAFYREHGVQAVSFDELVERSEVLSLHLPLTRATHNLYNAAVLDRLRDDCVLINTCRGGIVNEAALLERLESNRILAAGFDVFEIEPAQNDRLLSHPNLIATPHIGASTRDARIAMVGAAIDGLTEGKLVDPVDYADYMD
ncbi:MAG: phosphoglycerate dehydrogenase [Hydrogenophaga sp.]|nr:phosphoglycerate dehydrogenase [Hydrogenophaga sp.]